MQIQWRFTWMSMSTLPTLWAILSANTPLWSQNFLFMLDWHFVHAICMAWRTCVTLHKNAIHFVLLYIFAAIMTNQLSDPHLFVIAFIVYLMGFVFSLFTRDPLYKHILRQWPLCGRGGGNSFFFFKLLQLKYLAWSNW